MVFLRSLRFVSPQLVILLLLLLLSINSVIMVFFRSLKFVSPLFNLQPRVRYSGTFYSPLVVPSSVPQGSVSGTLLFNSFVNDFYDVINLSNCVLFADDLEICRAASTFRF
jgi:hypothetical protein